MEKMTLKEQVYNQIFDDIAQGKYQANDILTESKLMEKYQVSKSPVREALIELCKDEVVHSLPRLGYQVVLITLKEVLDILEYRTDIEISGLRRGFAAMTDQDIEDLVNIAPKEGEESHAPNWDRNYVFHLRLYQINGNEYGYRELQKTIKQSSRYVSQYFQSAWKKGSAYTSTYHKDIVACLKARDLEGACRMLETDIVSIKDEIQRMHDF